MLTFSLDEYGDFEGLTSTNGPIYIAGLIFDDKDEPGETEMERARVQAFYKAAIADAADNAEEPSRFQYPASLHSNGDPVRNHNVVRPVKNAVKKALPEFIKQGTYNGNILKRKNSIGEMSTFADRKGEYHIFTLLRSDVGMTRLLSEHASILAKDDYASNLYFHMADELVSRLLFYNPLIENIQDVTLNIATRTSPDLPHDSTLVKEYLAQGYKPNKSDENDPKSQVYFNLTNADIYRAVIAEEIMDADRPHLKITSFRVDSILYFTKAKGMEFLYLADSICSMLAFKIKGNSADEWLRHIDERVKKITGKEQNLIFGYDEIDRDFSKAWKKYLDGDYYTALSIAFYAKKKKGVFSEYYEAGWFTILEEKIKKSTNLAAFHLAVLQLRESQYNNALDQEKSLYILQNLEALIPTMEKLFHTPEARRILYFLYDAGVTAYCHIGDSANAEKYFKKCTEISYTVSLEDYLNTRNKMVVYYCDYFDLNHAEKIANDNLMYQELLTDLRIQAKLPGSEDGTTELGKTYSQRAQVYAFKRNPCAEDDFLSALSNFEPGSANYKITQSYLLHYYLDNGKKQEYLDVSRDYFGGEASLAGQLKYIIVEGSGQDPLINMKYALYVYVRALFTFRMSELTDKIWNDLNKVESVFGKIIQKKDWVLAGHPAELIFRYLTMIAFLRGDTRREKQYVERMDHCLLYYGRTEEVVREFGRISIFHLKQDITNRDLASKDLCRYLVDIFDVYKNAEIPAEGEERYKWLKERITFMYT